MKISVWCKDGVASLKEEDNVRGLKVWEGAVKRVPCVGEYVIVHEGWSSEEVLEVHSDLSSGTVSVEIGPDWTGEYAARKEARGIGGRSCPSLARSVKCPGCGRRPSERCRFLSTDAEGRWVDCPNPLHDAADRYAECGEEMERAAQALLRRSVDDFQCCICLAERHDPDAEPYHNKDCPVPVLQALLARLPAREEKTDA